MPDHSHRLHGETRANATAIILVGGLGTRLGDLTADIPKPMLPIADRPFVEYLVSQLRRSGFRTVVFASGYRSEQLREHFATGSRFGVAIRYSVESQPLGTGGAIRLAARMVDADRMLIMNGDSFLDADPRLVMDAVTGDTIVAMGLTRVADISRYGSVESDVDGVVTRFFPAGVGQGPGLINAGIYGAARSLIGLIPSGTASSFERDVLPVLAGQGLRGVALDGFFIDIGVPDSYQQLAADPGPLLRAMDAGRMRR